MSVGRWVMNVFPGAQEAGAWNWEGEGRGVGGGTYVRCEHGVAGRGLVHRHREAEGASPQAAVLQQWDPLGRGWGSGWASKGREGTRRAGAAVCRLAGASQ